MSILKYATIVAILLTFFPFEVQGLKQPAEYGYNECELIAHDFQKEFGGSMIFIAPKSWDTGEWIKGDYAGHWVNLIYISGDKKSFYFDYGNQRIFPDKTSLLNWYSHEFSGYDAEVFNVNAGEKPSYPLIFHY